MTKYLIFYAFHRLDSLSLSHLEGIMSLNPGVQIVPCFGAGEGAPFKGTPLAFYHDFNFRAFRSPYLWRYFERRSWELFRGNETVVRGRLAGMGLEPYFDYTPLGYYFQDEVILRWYRTRGRGLDFDRLVYLEYDVLTTKGIKELYAGYEKLDAAFVEFGEPGLFWGWGMLPVGYREGLRTWLRSRGLPSKVYRGFFPGFMLSREVLEAVAPLRPPPAYCEMRLPTLAKAFGFAVGKINFPFVRYLSLPEGATESRSAGIFHPVR